MTNNIPNNIPNKDATDLVCIQLEVHIWSGRRHLEKTDLVHANPEFGKLPEKDLANLGSVKICNPEDIKEFQKIKNQAELVLSRAGLPILGSTGVPAAKFAEVNEKLQELQATYAAKAAAFLNSYDTKLSQWKLKHLIQHPEWDQLFRDLPTAEHVGGRLSFEFHPYRISAPADASMPALNQRFEKQMGGLKGELLREVATEAGTFINSLSKRTDHGVSTKREFVTPKTLGPLRRAAEKLDAFAFIDPTIGPLAKLITNMLNGMPDLGRVDGEKLLLLSGIARLLNDSRGISELSNIAFEGGTAEDAVSAQVNVNVTPPDPVTTGSSTEWPDLLQEAAVIQEPLSILNVAATPAAAFEQDNSFLSLLI